jgi:hypothetical protein
MIDSVLFPDVLTVDGTEKNGENEVNVVFAFLENVLFYSMFVGATGKLPPVLLQVANTEIKDDRSPFS